MGIRKEIREGKDMKESDLCKLEHEENGRKYP